MPIVSGYLLTRDGGAAGPSVKDQISGEKNVSFEAVENPPTGTGVVNYASLGDVSGTFYTIGGDDVFVPDDPAGFPLAETGTVNTFTASILGTAKDDKIAGTADGEIIQDTDGSLWDETGDDKIYAGGGDDTIRFGDGNDTIHGDDGDDVIGWWESGEGSNLIYGDAGNDMIIGGWDDDTIYGGTGNDTLAGNSGNDLLFGGAGDDEFWVSDDSDQVTIDGGDAADWDSLWFDNWLTSTGVTVTWTSGDSADFSYAGTPTSGTFTAIDAIGGTDNADSIDASLATGWQDIYAAGGDDTIITGAGGTYVEGNAGDDNIIGGTGNDYFIGGTGADTLDGGAGDDELTGGAGDDLLTGGDGSDTFFFSTGGGNDIVTDFDMTDSGDGTTIDRLDVADLVDDEGNPVHAGDIAVSDDGSGNAVLTFPSGETVTLQGVAPESVTSSALVSMGVPCFTAGTMIRTQDGEVPVEHLCPGDRVQTVDNGLQELVWVGQRRLGRAELALYPRRRPILIREGALGNVRDMLVSPQHGMLINHPGGARLVRAGHLARHGGPGFRRANGRREVTYLHLMFDTHQIVFADGTPSESFLPGPMGLVGFPDRARAEVLVLFPDLRPDAGPRSRSFAPARAYLARRGVPGQISARFDMRACLAT